MGCYGFFLLYIEDEVSLIRYGDGVGKCEQVIKDKIDYSQYGGLKISQWLFRQFQDVGVSCGEEGNFIFFKLYKEGFLKLQDVFFIDILD